ncbi:MAG: hypothetical protein RR626_02700 [Anaerovoracaceae bacterium]
MTGCSEEKGSAKKTENCSKINSKKPSKIDISLLIEYNEREEGDVIYEKKDKKEEEKHQDLRNIAKT